MKTIKYLMSFWAILSLSVLFFACTDEDDSGSGRGDGKALRLSISAPEQKIVSPMTKADKGLADKIDDLCILIYDNNDDLLSSKSQYVSSGITTSGNTAYTTTIELPDNPTGRVVVIANAGNLLNTRKVGEYSDLNNLKFGLQGSSVLPAFVMYDGDTTFDLTKETNVQVELERIYSMITVDITKDLDPNITVTPISLQLKNVPDNGYVGAPNCIGNNNVGSESDAEIITPDNPGENFLSSGNTYALFLYENMKGNGQNTGEHASDQRYKTPPGMEVTMDRETVFDAEESKSCPYIEIVAKYTNLTVEGIIKYRFFLGNNAVNNFDVQRNIHYSIHLTLTGTGGEDEASWRVDYDFLDKIKPQNIYIGYRDQSISKMYLGGKVADYVNNIGGKHVTITPDALDGFGDYFEIVTNQGDQIQTEQDDSGKTRYYVEIKAKRTNIHDYQPKVGSITFTLSKDNSGLTPISETGTVTQVPRLVDPIAFYKKADNTTSQEIKVKEFVVDAGAARGRYKTLFSRSKENREAPGTWSVRIDATTEEKWFTIATTEEGLGQGVDALNGVISGTGDVVFWYKPKDVAGASPRFAKLVVRYHDEECEHIMFLRQGYNDIILGDQGRAWSSFNCLGTKEDFSPQDGPTGGPVTEYPTQTGWLFNGGIDKAMHPFLPEYRTGVIVSPPGMIYDYTKIRYSDNKEYVYGERVRDIYDDMDNVPEKRWQGNILGEYQRPNTPSKRGPCPADYVVADAFDYKYMLKETEVYTGYVHDDDPDSGWNYDEFTNSGADATLDNNNHCNPAKGALFVSKNDKCTNLFFGFGKGVLPREYLDDQKLLSEIGIGHRFGEDQVQYPEKYLELPAFAHLTYGSAGKGWTYLGQGHSNMNNVYGAYYWNASTFSRVYMGKIDFGYNIFTTYPYLIDVPGEAVPGGGTSAKGINLYQHGSFVRCVKPVK